MFLFGKLIFIGVKLSRTLQCPQCNKEWELRWGIFAHDSISRHMKEHK
jgi:predicted  nucleic acid-binding Zn ribbon protein